MTYFTHTSTPEELKARYRDLCKIHHPDKGGSDEVMQEINAEYDKVTRQRFGKSAPEFDGDLQQYFSDMFEMSDDDFVDYWRKNKAKVFAIGAFALMSVFFRKI